MMSLLGTGRVWSEMMITQSFLPLASSQSRGAVDGIFHRGADDIAAAALRFQLADAAGEHARSLLFKIYMGLPVRNMYHFIPL